MECPDGKSFKEHMFLCCSNAPSLWRDPSWRIWQAQEGTERWLPGTGQCSTEVTPNHTVSMLEAMQLQQDPYITQVILEWNYNMTNVLIIFSTNYLLILHHGQLILSCWESLPILKYLSQKNNSFLWKDLLRVWRGEEWPSEFLTVPESSPASLG